MSKATQQLHVQVPGMLMNVIEERVDIGAYSTKSELVRIALMRELNVRGGAQ